MVPSAGEVLAKFGRFNRRRGFGMNCPDLDATFSFNPDSTPNIGLVKNYIIFPQFWIRPYQTVPDPILDPQHCQLPDRVVFYSMICCLSYVNLQY
jgi:hypothetical protein